MISFVFAVALMASAADPATAAAAEPAKDAAAKPAKAKPEMVCTKEKVAGSNLPKRVCVTKAQAEQSKTDGREALEAVQRSTNVPN